MTRGGKNPMETRADKKIKLTDMDKHEAITTFVSVYAMAKIKMMLKRYLNRARARILKKT